MNSPPHHAVEAHGLTKAFGSERAVDGLDLTVPTGCVYGFLGPNGAGKTTTVRMLATLLRPDAGTARVLGHDVVRDAGAVRERIALTGQFAALDDDLTGRENLVVAARLSGHRPSAARARADELLDTFGLSDAAARQVKGYSGGMRRRLDIAASLVATPDLLFLDEPTTGLDPASRNRVWDTVRTLAAGGTTVLLTTQYLAEADALATRIGVIDHGALVAEGTPAELRAAGGTTTLHVRVADPATRHEARQVFHRILRQPGSHAPEPGLLTATGIDAEQAAHVIGELRRAGIALAEFSLAPPTLDEVFLALTTTAGSRPDA